MCPVHDVQAEKMEGVGRDYKKVVVDTFIKSTQLSLLFHLIVLSSL